MSNTDAGIVIEALGNLDAEYRQLPFGPDHPLTFAAFLYLKLDAANQRNAELTEQRNTISGHFAHLEMCRDNATVRAEDAERKLADVREQVQFVKDWFLKLEDGLPESDPLTAMRRKYHAPVHAALDNALAQIEQTQQVTGTAPNTKGRDWVRERFVGERESQSTLVDREESDCDKRLALALSWIDRTMARIIHLGLKETIFEQSQIGEPQITPVTRADRDNLIALIGANLNDQSVGSDDIADALIAAGWRK